MVSNLAFMMTASVNNVTTIQFFYSVFIKLIWVLQSTWLSAGIWEPGSCQHCCSASKSGASLTTSFIILVYLQSACQLRLLIVSVLSLEANRQCLHVKWLLSWWVWSIIPQILLAFVCLYNPCPGYPPCWNHFLVQDVFRLLFSDCQIFMSMFPVHI
jgi:hypothetical protein